MLISPRHGFVFLCTPKCASTAIEQALAPHAGVRIGGTPQMKHAGFADYQRHVEPFLRDVGAVDIAGLTVLALMREPMDWLASWWRYRQRPALADPAHPNHANYTGGIAFDDWLDRYFAGETGLRRQHDHLNDVNGGYAGIEIHRYEALDGFATRVSELVGSPIRFGTVNASPRAHDVARAGRDQLEPEYALYHGL